MIDVQMCHDSRQSLMLTYIDIIYLLTKYDM